MAVSASSYFNFALQGVPQVGGGVDLYSSDSSPKFVLGTKYERLDGSVFRYVHFGATVSAGVLVAQDLSESSVAFSTSVLAVAPTTAQAVPNESISAGKIGSRYVELSVQSVTADQLAGGYLALTSYVGSGFIYPIIGNTATDNPASGNIRVQLAVPLSSAIDATTEFQLVGSRWANLEIATAATDNDLAGVSVVYQKTAGTFGWVQTQGTAAVLGDSSAAMAAGDIITLSDGVSGAVQTMGGGSLSTNAEMVAEQIVGYCIVAPSGTAGTCQAVVQRPQRNPILCYTRCNHRHIPARLTSRGNPY